MQNLSEILFSDIKLNEATNKIKILFDSLKSLQLQIDTVAESYKQQTGKAELFSTEIKKINTASQSLISSVSNIAKEANIGKVVNIDGVRGAAGTSSKSNDDPTKLHPLEEVLLNLSGLSKYGPLLEAGYRVIRTIVNVGFMEEEKKDAQRYYYNLKQRGGSYSLIRPDTNLPNDIFLKQQWNNIPSLFVNGDDGSQYPYNMPRDQWKRRNKKKNTSLNSIIEKQYIPKLKTELDELNELLELEELRLKEVESQSDKNSEAYIRQAQKVNELKSQIDGLSTIQTAIKPEAFVSSNASSADLTSEQKNKITAEENAEFEIAKINAELIENSLERSIALIRITLEKELESIANNDSLSVSTRRRLGKAKKEEANKKISDLESQAKDKTTFADVLAEKLNEGLGVANEIVKALEIPPYTLFGGLVEILNKALPIATAIGNALQVIGLISTGGLSGFLGAIGSVFGKLFSFLGFASGGVVPGTGNRDTVPAMLTPGEFVISKPNVSRLISAFGNNFLSFLNPSTMLPSLPGHYALGGVVSNMPAPANINLKVEFDDMKLKLNTLYTAVKKQQTTVKRGYLL